MNRLDIITKDTFEYFGSAFPDFVKDRLGEEGLMLFGFTKSGKPCGGCAVSFDPAESELIWFVISEEDRSEGLATELLFRLMYRLSELGSESLGCEFPSDTPDTFTRLLKHYGAVFEELPDQEIEGKPGESFSSRYARIDLRPYLPYHEMMYENLLLTGVIDPKEEISLEE